MNNTKKKIIENTIQLFNEFGFANVKLPLIAETSGISLGNLTYHFPKKEGLIENVYQLFQEELAQITKDYEVLSDFGEMNLQLRDFYKFQQRFRFFYLDLLEIERAFPSIAQKHHAHIEGQINGLEKSFIYNVGLNYLEKYDSPRIYRHLARQFWMCTVFWLMQLAVRGKDGTIDEMTESAWMLVYPYTTNRGKANFSEIFGIEKIG